MAYIEKYAGLIPLFGIATVVLIALYHYKTAQDEILGQLRRALGKEWKGPERSARFNRWAFLVLILGFFVLFITWGTEELLGLPGARSQTLLNLMWFFLLAAVGCLVLSLLILASLDVAQGIYRKTERRPRASAAN
ncbi:MAG TPA: hypothetical protein VI455_12260 [Terriglobia bacterium]